LYEEKPQVSSIRKVYINGRFLCQEATGVQKFASGISRSLQKNNPEFIIIAPKGIPDLQGLRVKQTVWGGGTFWEQLWLPLFLWFHPGSVLINLGNTAPLVRRRQLVTIHDLAFLKDKSWFSPAFRRWYRFLIPRICKKSIAVLTVSTVIKNEIANEYAVADKKIKIIPNGIHEMEFDEQKPYPFRYLFMTGIYNPRKNAAFIISLLPEIKKWNYHIVCVGADAGIYGNTGFVQDDHLHLLKYLDDKHYNTLMKHAEALIYPSEYEGFGIPVLEALILGTSALVPDIPVYRESFGTLPIYYAAGNQASFLESLETLNNKKPTNEESVFLKNKYNFDKSAAILADIIKQYL